MTRKKATNWIEFDETKNGLEDFGHGYCLPRAFTAGFARSDLPAEVEFHAVLEDGRYRVESLTALRRKGGSVTLEVLRDIPVATLLSEAALSTLQQGDEAEDIGDLQYVALIYRIAHACGAPPRQAVEREFGTSRATAGRLIEAARGEGFLGPAIGERRPGERRK